MPKRAIVLPLGLGLCLVAFCATFPLKAQNTYPIWIPIWSAEFDAADDSIRDCPPLVFEQDGYNDYPKPYAKGELVQIKGLDLCDWGLFEMPEAWADKDLLLTPEALFVENGRLRIRAYWGKDPITGKKQGFSGGLQTKPMTATLDCNCNLGNAELQQNKQDLQGFMLENGRLEGRLLLPAKRKGVWPALWLLPCGRNLWWPHAGEIDLMEYWYKKLPAKRFVQSTYHFQNRERKGGVGFRFFPSRRARLAGWWEQFHVWAVEWDSLSMRFFVDSLLIGELREGDSYFAPKYGDTLEVDLPPTRSVQSKSYSFFIMANLAVWLKRGFQGADYQIDYIRAYKKGDASDFIDQTPPAGIIPYVVSPPTPQSAGAGRVEITPSYLRKL